MYQCVLHWPHAPFVICTSHPVACKQKQESQKNCGLNFFTGMLDSRHVLLLAPKVPGSDSTKKTSRCCAILIYNL